MREVSFLPRGKTEDVDTYLNRSLQLIAKASMEDAMVIADGYSVSNFTATRTLDAATATTAQLANFVATFINDLKTRGPNRTQ